MADCRSDSLLTASNGGICAAPAGSIRPSACLSTGRSTRRCRRLRRPSSRSAVGCSSTPSASSKSWQTIARTPKSISEAWRSPCPSAVSNCAASEAPARFDFKRTFRQDDPPTELQLRRDKAESERSGERLPLAARRVSAANQFAGGISKGPPIKRRASTAWRVSVLA